MRRGRAAAAAARGGFPGICLAAHKIGDKICLGQVLLNNPNDKFPSRGQNKSCDAFWTKGLGPWEDDTNHKYQ